MATFLTFALKETIANEKEIRKKEIKRKRD
jgi:hypothetical protein